MSDPDRSPRHAEIHLDLDGPDPGLEPAPPRRRRVPNSALALAAAALTLAAAITTAWTWLPGQDPLAERTVRAFLEAVHDGDVETALSMADPADGPRTFLTPEALDDRWKINEVAQVEYQANEEGTSWVSEVYAEIEAYDGTRIGRRLTVSVRDGEPTILNGFTETEVYPSPYYQSLIEINGIRADFDEVVTFQLLPGLYDFYEGAPETLDFGTSELLALGDSFIDSGGHVATGMLGAPFVQVTEVGFELLNGKVREYLDGCAADPGAEGCPLAPPTRAGNIEIEPGAAWTITSYPEAVVDLWEIGTGPPALATSRPGSAEVEATIEEPGGGTRETTLSCPLLVEWLRADFPYEGGVELSVDPSAEMECPSMAEAG